MADPVSPTGVEAPSEVDVVVEDHQTDVAIDAPRWAALAAHTLRAEGARGELTLTFVDVDEITSLNVEHMGKEGPTDVLSFPLDALDEPIAGEPILLGDVVVCPAVAAEAAPDHAGTVDDELALLVVHGCLHVLGYDHAEPDETVAMRTRELELLCAFHWDGPAPEGFRQEQDG
ncbi:MAG: rRNA maturation RNase YbeY [Ilumatobacter sp.]|nr:rRNA maturation RNase YbeY [Ilumatobacter sp.]